MKKYDPSDTPNNAGREGRMAFGDITASYLTIIPLGNLVYNHLSVKNGYNESATLRFGGTQEFIFNPGDMATFDDFDVNGDIEVKHNGVVPASGTFVVRFW